VRWEDLEKELLARPGVREEIERLYPYDAVAFEINGLRAERDMTQTEFGRLIGVPQSTVARLESGTQAPSVATLKRIAQATGTELVIEFRRPKRKRRTKRPTAAASSASDAGPGEPLAAAGTDD
jgi:transcriptional regulator with XRE-family HTH domain